MIGIFLRARNSSGLQHLLIQSEQGEHHLCLIGEYEEKPIQIDFDLLTNKEMKEIADFIYSRIGEAVLEVDT